MPVHFAPLALRAVVRKQPVETARLLKRVLGSRLQFVSILSVQAQRYCPPHRSRPPPEPQGLGAGGYCKNRRQKQNYHKLFHSDGGFSPEPRDFLARASTISIRSSDSEPK